MPTIIINTTIKARKEICFDHSRDVDFHTKSLAHSKEKAIAGKTSGLLKLNDSVTWEAYHFGIKQRLSSKITEYIRPHYFVDEMVRGIFKSFRHEHHFISEKNNTIVTDKFIYQSPYGYLGQLVDFLFLKQYMTRLLKKRNYHLKYDAERREKLASK